MMAEPPKTKLRVPIWFWMLLFMAACLFGFGAYVIATLP
jgi:hypothetical protein